MIKPKPKDQLQKCGRKSDFRPEYILIAKACARFGAIEDEMKMPMNLILVRQHWIDGSKNVRNLDAP
jgi:hypothetical protein